VSDGIDFDFSEINQLAADLGSVADNAGPFIRSAVQFTATNVKRDAAKAVGSSAKGWKPAAAAIDYDIKAEAGQGGSNLTAEVGYNKEKGAGPLGSLREFGAPGQQLAPHNDLANALESNQADFQKGLEIAVKDAERKAGL
jgi:hypothetical protein